MHTLDVTAAVACVVVVGSLTLVSANTIRRGDSGSIAHKDAARIQHLHQAMLHFACDDPTGALPIPGRINLWTDDRLGSNPSIGRENQSKNTSGHLYSALIARNYITTADVISPAEVADNVHEYTGSTENGVPTGKGYEYDAYDPVNDIFWVGDISDPLNDFGGSGPSGISMNRRFRAAINRPYDPANGNLCSTSYAHLMLCGKRKMLDWRVDASANTPLLSNRGPKNGVSEGEDYTRSPTLRFYEPHDAWQGNVLFGDGHVVFADTFQPAGVTYVCDGVNAEPDNIFDKEFESCAGSLPNMQWQEGDAWLALNEISIRSSESWRAIALYDRKIDK